jgi:hypothetical protein
MFFYKNDTQEIDIEFLSDASSRSNPGDGSRPMHYTNMPTRGGVSSHATGPARSDATYARHEYRIDWLPGRTQFFLDGVLQHTHTTNVPTVAGSWLCNNWGYVVPLSLSYSFASFFCSPFQLYLLVELAPQNPLPSQELNFQCAITCIDINY